jgi:hypothetical protein
MAEIKGGVGEVRATVHIKRHKTGEVETHELVGKVTQEERQALQDAGLLNEQPRKQEE